MGTIVGAGRPVFLSRQRRACRFGAGCHEPSPNGRPFGLHPPADGLRVPLASSSEHASHFMLALDTLPPAVAEENLTKCPASVDDSSGLPTSVAFKTILIRYCLEGGMFIRHHINPSDCWLMRQ